MLLVFILLLMGLAVYLLANVLISTLEEKRQVWQAKKEETIGKELDKMFYSDKSPKEIIRLYYILPLIFGIAGWVVFHTLIFALGGAILGLFIPSLILKIRYSKRRQKFNSQLLDTIMLLSGTLKGGLSLLQGMEVIVEEMPAPISQEIGLVVRENKMGVGLDESLKNLSKRMNLEELNLVVNSLLVARETGGDLIKVLSRLGMTIRDNRKLKDSIKTLTLQGRLQGIIMSVLPFIFIWFVLSFNRGHFDIMLKNEMGRVLLVAAMVLQAVGIILIKKFSTVRI